MALKQLTVFVENKQGTLVNITDTLAANNVNIRALSIAETDGFGILRLIVDNEVAAEKVLTEAGYLIKITEVVGVKIGDAPGKLSYVLRTLADAGINMEYLYAFMARTACTNTRRKRKQCRNRSCAGKCRSAYHYGCRCQQAVINW